MSDIEKEKDDGMIAIDLSTMDRDTLIDMFIERNLLAVSKTTFDEVLKSGSTVRDALYDAILNEEINNALTEMIKIEERKAAGQPDDFTNDE